MDHRDRSIHSSWRHICSQCGSLLKQNEGARKLAAKTSSSLPAFLSAARYASSKVMKRAKRRAWPKTSRLFLSLTKESSVTGDTDEDRTRIKERRGDPFEDVTSRRRFLEIHFSSFSFSLYFSSGFSTFPDRERKIKTRCTIYPNVCSMLRAKCTCCLARFQNSRAYDRARLALLLISFLLGVAKATPVHSSVN